MCCSHNKHGWNWWNSHSLYVNQECRANGIFTSVLGSEFRSFSFMNKHIYRAQMPKEKQMVLIAALRLAGVWNDNVL